MSSVDNINMQSEGLTKFCYNKPQDIIFARVSLTLRRITKYRQVNVDDDADVVDVAYKCWKVDSDLTLPPRFASVGQFYQTGAHLVTVLLRFRKCFICLSR